MAAATAFAASTHATHGLLAPALQAWGAVTLYVDVIMPAWFPPPLGAVLRDPQRAAGHDKDVNGAMRHFRDAFRLAACLYTLAGALLLAWTATRYHAGHNAARSAAALRALLALFVAHTAAHNAVLALYHLPDAAQQVLHQSVLVGMGVALLAWAAVRYERLSASRAAVSATREARAMLCAMARVARAMGLRVAAPADSDATDDTSVAEDADAAVLAVSALPAAVAPKTRRPQRAAAGSKKRADADAVRELLAVDADVDANDAAVTAADTLALTLRRSPYQMRGRPAGGRHA